MAVYVDDVVHNFGRMKMCHLWADTMEELLAAVDAIGVARKWIQTPPKASWVHFDICLSKKKAAIEHGAILTDKYGPVVHVATQKLAILSDKLKTVQEGSEDSDGTIAATLLARIAKQTKMIENVESIRASRTKERKDAATPQLPAERAQSQQGTLF